MTPTQARRAALGGYTKIYELMDYIKVYPQNFFEFLLEGIGAEEERIFDLLEDFSTWDDERMEEWRQLNGDFI